MTVIIYHNPRCSKSRLTLALLQERGLDLEIIEYLNNPPNAKTLDMLLKKLDLEPREFMRRNEATYSELSLDDDALDRKFLIHAMIKNPILIERPIVIANNQARLGRPPERVLEIL